MYTFDILFLQVAYSGLDRSCMLRRLQADTEYSVTVRKQLVYKYNFVETRRKFV